MIPIIIYIIIVAIDLVKAGYNHGKERTGKNNAYIDIASIILLTILLYYGGFFDALLN
jgi:hypothetical protein